MLLEEEHDAILAVQVPSEHLIGFSFGQSDDGQETLVCAQLPSGQVIGVEPVHEVEHLTAQVPSKHLVSPVEQGHATLVCAQLPSGQVIGVEPVHEPEPELELEDEVQDTAQVPSEHLVCPVGQGHAA